MIRTLSITTQIGLVVATAALCLSATADESLQPVKLQSSIRNVQPMTGIVLWTTHEAVNTAPIQLEYSYLTYREVVDADGSYNWDPLEKLLSEVAARQHQLILRWHDTYVGKKTGIPEFIAKLPSKHKRLDFTRRL